MNTTLTKYLLFLFAYLPIYIIVALKNINPNIFNIAGEPIPLKAIIQLNVIPILLVVLCILLLLFFKIHQIRSLKARGNSIFTIKEVSIHNKEYITYLGTYILPFTALETKTCFDVLAYAFMFLTIGFIFAKTNLIYTNPMLIVFGYEMYEVTTTKGGKFICISKTVPESNESPIGIKVGDKTYIISKWKNEA